jgi:hypothetical protein
MLSVPPTVAIREGGHERVLVDTTKNLTSQFLAALDAIRV